MTPLFDDYFISTDKTLLDITAIHDFLSNRSYWAQGIGRDRIERAIQNSITFGIYSGQEQAAYARVVTDYATFGWVCDVFVSENHRGKGLSKLMMRAVVAHPDLSNLRRLVLATADAHGLYAQVGFEPLPQPERWMMVSKLDLYLNS
jgi:N-acetylglutamate synthase-like GNAT family acetyltransferase